MFEETKADYFKLFLTQCPITKEAIILYNAISPAIARIANISNILTLTNI